MLRTLSLVSLLIVLVFGGCCFGHHARHHRASCDKSANCNFKAPPCETAPCKTVPPCGKPCCATAVPVAEPVDKK